MLLPMFVSVVLTIVAQYYVRALGTPVGVKVQDFYTIAHEARPRHPRGGEEACGVEQVKRRC
jgi:hypothetical protein